MGRGGIHTLGWVMGMEISELSVLRSAYQGRAAKCLVFTITVAGSNSVMVRLRTVKHRLGTGIPGGTVRRQHAH